MINILITICARGGSVGVPGKNIKEINGLPLIAYTINTAKKFSAKFNADLGLSTDSDEIRSIAAKYGLVSEYKRPAELATATAGKIPVIEALKNFEELKNKKQYDFVIDLDVSSPLRTLTDLEEAFELLNSSDGYNVFSVNEANRNPYFNMVEKNEAGYVNLVKDLGAITARQLAPAVYDMNASFYIFRKSFFEKQFKTSITDKSLAYVMNHICFDIDHPIDFKFMELVIRENIFSFDS
jgi:CMP-N-acetylneuraminic acid synthetase